MRKFLIISLLLFSGQFLSAQKFTASASKTKVSAGEAFQVDFSLVNTSGKNFSPPSFSDFTVYSGPNQYSSSQFSSTGGMTQTITISYILIPKKEGTFTIEPASVSINGSIVQSNSLAIEVSKTNTQSVTQGESDNLFARTSVSKTKVYTGEQVVITHKVYARLNLRGFQDMKLPSYNGFWVQDAQRAAQQYEITQENVDGVTYSVVEIKKAFLFPQHSGKIEIQPMEIECVVREKTKGRSNDPFEQFFSSDPFFGNYKDKVITVKSNSVTFDVQPLPEAGKPADFPGAVGNFSMSASIDKDKVKQNEGVNLKITISGKGNLKLIDSPKLNFPDEFETYDPKSNENITVGDGGVSGTKTFEYLLIPRHEGTFTIPSWNFNYFDADKKTYIALPSKTFSITVEKGEGSAANNTPLISQGTQGEVKILANDIRYIKTGKINFAEKDRYFFGSPLFIGGFAVSPLLFLAFIFLRREHIRRNSDLILVKKRKAGGIAKKFLALAEKSMKNDDKENFFANILAALYNYIEHKMNLPAAEHSKEKVIEVLQSKNVSEEMIAELVKLMDECEFARYAPGRQAGNLQEVYDRAANSINKIDNVL